jgi:hypothetical protein
MREERPYLVNYMLALMLVMSLHMFINSISTLLYPTIFVPTSVSSSTYLIIFVGVSIWEMMLTFFLYIGSGIAYKFTVLTLIVMVTLTATNMAAGGNMGFDLWMQTVLGAVSLVLTQIPQVKSFYDNWSLGKLPQTEL